MSMSNFTPELLQLKDPNVKFSNNVSKNNKGKTLAKISIYYLIKIIKYFNCFYKYIIFKYYVHNNMLQ